MDVRRAVAADFAGVVNLQDRNLSDRVNENDRGGGFLSNRFSEQQFKAIADDVCVVVAVEDGTVVGFLCGSDMKAMENNPLVHSMISADSGAMSPDSTCLGGPVCIDTSQRGKGLMGRLYDCLCAQLQGTKYKDVAVFIDESNKASTKAHEKIGFRVTNTFTHGDRKYMTLMMPCW